MVRLGFTAGVIYITENYDMALPQIMREIGGWMAKNHYDICF
jgi:hypothetical protein